MASEVQRLMAQIEAEYTSALRGLTGVAAGTARHDFIAARYHNMGVYCDALSQQVGEEQATNMLIVITNRLNACHEWNEETHGE